MADKVLIYKAIRKQITTSPKASIAFERMSVVKFINIKQLYINMNEVQPSALFVHQQNDKVFSS